METRSTVPNLRHVNLEGTRRLIPMLVAMVEVISVEHHDEVRILLNLAAVPQARHQRPLAATLLSNTIELRQDDNRDAEFYRMDLRIPADLIHQLCSVRLPIIRCITWR